MDTDGSFRSLHQTTGHQITGNNGPYQYQSTTASTDAQNLALRFNGNAPPSTLYIESQQQYASHKKPYSDQGGVIYADTASMPRSTSRRSKRNIPEGEKDDRYWEKRKRNNEAAKRSRENKRRLDFEIRNRLSYLEEENALLQRELEILKTKFGFPVDQSILSAEERREVLAQVDKTMAGECSPVSDDMEITMVSAPLMINKMDLSLRMNSAGIPLKREVDETYMTSHPSSNGALVWHDQQAQPQSLPLMMSFVPNDVSPIRRMSMTSPHPDIRPFSVIQSPTLLRNPVRNIMTPPCDVSSAQSTYIPTRDLSQPTLSISPERDCLISSLNEDASSRKKSFGFLQLQSTPQQHNNNNNQTIYGRKNISRLENSDQRIKLDEQTFEVARLKDRYSVDDWNKQFLV